MPEHHEFPRPTDAEAVLRQQTRVLGERVKELQCLYAIAALVAKPHIALEALCQGIVEVMPRAWQYPDIACGRIVLDNGTFTTHNFQPTRWQLSSDIQVDGECIGSVAIYYLEETPDSGVGPFLHEEQHLLHETLSVLVEDHGTGFEPQHIPATSHGLAGMRERVNALGGQLTIDSAPGAGTCILAELPLCSHPCCG